MDVRAAARRTLDAGSARIWQRAFFDPKPAQPLMNAFLLTVEGVADLTRRRARLESVTGGAEMDALIDRVSSKWPWLGDDGDEGDHARFHTVVVGNKRYIGREGRWMQAEPSSQLDNPAWILDALAGAGGATHVGAEEVRGTSCERYSLDRVDLREAVKANNGALELPTRTTALRGDIWCDRDGRVRRVTWSQLHRGRPRLQRNPPPHRLWNLVEFWDFGLPVTIETPDAGPPPADGPFLRDLWEFGSELRRMRADSRRRHPDG